MKTDSTLGIVFKGYPYFLEKFREQDSDIYETRLLFTKTTSIKGEEAAKIFYNHDHFIRKGATPKRFQKTLFGQGGVQGLDDQAHRHRKDLFMKFMSPASIERLKQSFEKNWILSLKQWENSTSILLFEESERILCRAACEWTGVPLPESEVDKRTKYFSHMIDSPGAVGIRHLKGRIARKKAEHWVKGLVKEIRNKKLSISEDSILYTFSHHKDLEGQLLSEQVVAVEILNLLRPIVAIARYITFAALALYEHPAYHQRLKEGEEGFTHLFIQEVRRFYPFFPFTAAKVRQDFKWKEVNFPKGRRVLLDLYATNHDPKIWKEPGDFYPERFKTWDGSPFSFIPQGGGDHHKHHRCAGEWITIQITEIALNFLASKMKYSIPEQNLNIDLARIPAIPKSRFKMKDILYKEENFSTS